MHARSSRLFLGLVVAAATACAAARKEPVVNAAPGRSTDAEVPPYRAAVQVVLHARSIAPHESLAVRLLGVVGPDGGWSLQGVDLQQSAGLVRLEPRVRHVPARNVIQMQIPLDELLWLHLEPGEHRVQVLGRDSTLSSVVRVAAGSERPPPETHVAYQIVSFAAGARDFVTFTAWSADGFVDGIEVRESRAAGVGAWYRLQGCERDGDKLLGRIQVEDKGPILALEARAVDGQGQVDPSPAYLSLAERE